jgi:hypothetical protein
MKRDLDNDDIFKLLKASFTRAKVVAALEAEYEDGQVVSRRRSVAKGDKAKYEGFRDSQQRGTKQNMKAFVTTSLVATFATRQKWGKRRGRSTRRNKLRST